MKRMNRLSFLFALAISLSACSTYKPYAYDDIYYDPADDPIKKVQTNPNSSSNSSEEVTYDNSYPNRYTQEESSNYPEGMYQNRYIETEQAENNSSQNNNNQTVIINNNPNGEVEYYDEEYAETVRKLNTPVQSFNSYDPYTQARIAYTNDPFFYGPSLYGTYNFYDPFVPTAGLSLGWNSWSGWNVGIGIGFGYSSWAYPNPYWNPWRPTFGYNPWGPAWGWNAGWGYGWGCDPYWAGYNHGYYHGYHDGYFYGDHSTGGSSRTYINTPRGSSGSRAFTEQNRASRPQSSGSNTNYRLQNPENGNASTTRPSRQSVQPQQSIDGRRARTPQRYSTGNTPESYSRNRRAESRPSTSTPNNSLNPSANPSMNQASPTRPNRSRTNQSKPYSNDGYNSQPPRNSRSNPSIQSRPNYQSNPSNGINRSRPSYNRTPSYSPSPSMRGGGSRGGSSRPSRSAPSSRPRR